MKKRIFRTLSVLLSLLIIVSSCFLAFNTVSASYAVFYVENGGTGNGSTVESPLPSVDAAIEKAIADGHGSGDTVTIKTVGESAVPWGAANLTSHEFKLVITSADEIGIVGDGASNIYFGGDIHFTDIKVNFGSSWKHIGANGNNITFGDGSEYLGNVSMSAFYLGVGSGAKTYNSKVNVTAKIPIKKFGLANEYSAVTYNDDVNIVYDCATGTPAFTLTSAANANTYYNKGLNIDIKSASSVSFATVLGYNAVFGVDGYMQIMNNSATQLTAQSVGLSDIPSGKLLIINNKFGAKDLLEFTGTKGQFTVNTQKYHNIKAVDINNTENIITPVGNILTLPFGEYNITAEKLPQEVTYYIKNGGTGDGTSKEAPLPTVEAAIGKALSDGYIIGDTVTLKALGTDAVPWGVTSAVANMSSYGFMLKITSDEEALATVGEGGINVIFGGDIEFTDIKVNFGEAYKFIAANGKNVTFGEGVSYGGNNNPAFYMGSGVGNKVYDNKISVNSKLPIKKFGLTNEYHAVTFNDDVNISYEASSGTPDFIMSAAGYNTTYNKALNINVKSASGLNFKQADSVILGTDGYMQIINSSAKTIPASNNGLSAVSQDKLWVVNNITGNSGIIKFTDTAGKYEVVLDNPTHKVIAKNIATNEKTVYEYELGNKYITLDSGIYELELERDPIYKYYYVNPKDGMEITSGTRPATAGSEENPVKTYADATRLIAQDNLGKIDVAVILLPTDATTLWGYDAENFACTLIVDSQNSGVKAELLHEQGMRMVLTGNTIFDNISLTSSYQYSALMLNENNFTLRENASIDVRAVYAWEIASGVARTRDINIEVNGEFLTTKLSLASEYHNHTSSGDFNIIWNNPDSSLALELGSGQNTTEPNIYNGNINITVLNAASFALSQTANGAKINGSLQVLVDDSVLLPYSTKINFESFSAENKWYITNEADDDDFIAFTKDKGVYSVKQGAVAYTRQLNKNQFKHKKGIIDLSLEPGVYTVSDKRIKPLTDENNKMLYYHVGGGSHHIATRAFVEAGKTYIFEYSIYDSLYMVNKPTIRFDGNREVIEIEKISETKVGNYYKIVARGTIPEKYPYQLAFFGVDVSAFAEGVIFDRTVYEEGDADKTDLFEGNQKFYDGLDRIALDMSFWGGVFTGEKGGKGLVKWTDGFQQLEVMNTSTDYIDELIRLNNPDDGEWWNKNDIIPEKELKLYGKAKGTYKTQDGNGIKGTEFLFESDEKTYVSISDANGYFDFGEVLTGYYDLYILNGKEKIHTGYSTLVSEEDIVTIQVIETSSYITNEVTTPAIDETAEETDTPSGNLIGTVYTPQRETVPNLKIVLVGVGEVTTDDNGTFGFADIPIGEYNLYAINTDGTEYFFRKVEIKENVNLEIKLKYEPTVPSDTEATDNGWIIWVIIASVVALLVVGALVVFVVIRKKKV